MLGAGRTITGVGGRFALRCGVVWGISVVGIVVAQRNWRRDPGSRGELRCCSLGGAESDAISIAMGLGSGKHTFEMANDNSYCVDMARRNGFSGCTVVMLQVSALFDATRGGAESDATVVPVG